MRILRPAPAKKKLEVECSGCQALLEVEDGELERVWDHKTLVAYVFYCIGCSHKNVVYPSDGRTIVR